MSQPAPRTCRVLFLSLFTLVTLSSLVSCRDVRLFDSTYQEYYSERELEESLSKASRIYNHVLPDQEGLPNGMSFTVALVYENGDYDATASSRGYIKPPYYMDLSLVELHKGERTERHEGSSHHMARGSEVLSDLLVPNAYAARAPNAGNDITLKAEARVIVRSPGRQGRQTIFDHVIPGVTVNYGRGVSWEDYMRYPVEFIHVTGGAMVDGARAELDVVFARFEGEEEMRTIPTMEQIVAQRDVPEPKEAYMREGPFIMFAHGNSILYTHDVPASAAYANPKTTAK